MPDEPIQLADRAVVAVTGGEAEEFLQRILTCDVAPERGYGALLTPQGKILSDLFVFRDETGFLLDCAASQSADLIGRLTLYRLRARIGIGLRDDLAVHVGGGGAPPDPRLAGMGARQIGPRKGETADAGPYHARRVALGLADSEADIGSGELYPHEANLDQLNGVGFTKGCYVGQEVVSRMEHRSSARSRVLPVRCGGPAPPKGTEVAAAGKSIGTMLSSAGEDALALIRLDRLQDAYDAGAPVEAAGVPVAVRKPAWARFAVPERGR